MMREEDTCPVCDGRVGRVEDRIEDGETVLLYWHTDLEHKSEFCIERPNGDQKQILRGQGQPTGPRRA